MAGHDLLTGCTTPWRHDCPGIRHASTPEAFDAVVCHCPCHSLNRHIDLLQAGAPDEATLSSWARGDVVPDEARLRAALPDWLDRIAPSIRAFVAHIVVQDWGRR